MEEFKMFGWIEPRGPAERRSEAQLQKAGGGRGQELLG